MEQLITRTSCQLFRTLRSDQLPSHARRLLTQADIPKSELPKKTATKSESEAHNKDEKVSTTAATSDTISPSAPSAVDARMTAAGILLPKDTVSKLDSPEIGKEKPGKESLSDLPQEERRKKNRGKEQQQIQSVMKAWQISRFGDIEGLNLVEETKIPTLNDPSGKWSCEFFVLLFLVILSSAEMERNTNPLPLMPLVLLAASVDWLIDWFSRRTG